MSLPVASDLNATWCFIQPGLEFILGSQGDQGVTSKMYMNCYTAVYNYCVNKSRHGSASTQNVTVSGNSSYSLAGAEIYAKLDSYLAQFIKSLKQDVNESFLEFYVRKWRRFTVGAGYLNNVFDYMNRYWVQKERSDGRRDVFDVNTLSLLKWKTEMFNDNAETLIDQVLDQIEKQRDGEIVDTSLISSAIKSLVFLGIDVQDLKKPNLVVYIKHFEHKFLEKTSEYYNRESQNFLSEYNVVDYMKKCDTRLAEEVSRSNNYLEEHTKRFLLEVLNKVLIEDHAQEMYSQFLTLLEQNEIEHIRRMYNLLSRVPSTLQPLADTLEVYIKNQAAKALEEIKKSFENQEEATKASDAKPQKRSIGLVSPKSYIDTLITIYVQFNQIVLQAFNKDPIFIKSLDNACRHFVNKNPIANINPKASCKTPDYLARYADSFLKSTSKESEISSMNPENLMIVFKFVEDKDAFEEHYRRLLAKRLINGNSRSEEMEESIIQMLQEENSLEYTSKMTKMFSDMKSSEDLKNFVKEELGTSVVKDFKPLVLAQSMWPFKHSEDYNLKIAPELHPSFEKVKEIYNRKHSGRELSWLWNHGRAEVKANLSKKGKPPFLFTVTNTQLMILLAFNKQSSFTFAELIDLIGTSQNVLEAHLFPFHKYKLLDQSPSGPENFNKSDTVFTIVEEYKSKKLRVNFVSSIKTEQKQEEDDANKEIDESRKNYLSACIVRIMKTRKEMKHNELLNEVLTQSLSRFSAKIIDIKKVIDHLIEKEYIRRLNNDTYEYLA